MIPVKFKSAGSFVRGYFFPASGDPVIATVLFLQGFPGVEGDELICEQLARENVNVLTFNYRGTFQSEGIFSFSNAVADIGAAIAFLKESDHQSAYRIDPKKIVLGGWSFGSGIVFAGAVEHGEIRQIFAMSGRDFGKEARRIAEDPEYAESVSINLENIREPNGPVNYADDLLVDLINHAGIFDTQKLAPNLRYRNILLVGSWDDEILAVEEHIIPFYRCLKEQGTQARIEVFQGDHEFTGSKAQVVQAIVNWLREEQSAF